MEILENNKTVLVKGNVIGFEKSTLEPSKYLVQFPDLTTASLSVDMIEDDQPKPVLPKTVAEWLEMCKDENKQLRQSLNFMPFGANFWLSNSENQEIFARAWLDGYVTDKEDRYTIKLIETRQYLHKRRNDFFFDVYVRPKDNSVVVFTRKDLEDAGFGWVFDCPGVEVQEVGLC